MLLQRQVYERGRQPVDEAARLQVARYPNHEQRRFGPPHLVGHQLPDRALARPEAPRRTFTNDGDRGRASEIGGAEVAAGDERNAERREIARFHDVPRRTECDRPRPRCDPRDGHAAEADALEAAGQDPRYRRGPYVR